MRLTDISPSHSTRSEGSKTLSTLRNINDSISLQIHYLMILAANWAYLRSAVSTHEYQDIKTKDDQDLEAEARSKEGQNSSSYS